MRKLITIILILVCSKSFAQVYQLMPQYGYQANRFVFDSTLQIPTTCGVPTLKSVQFVTKRAAIAFDSCNNRFYQYNPKTQAWSQVSGGGGGSATLQDVTDNGNTTTNNITANIVYSSGGAFLSDDGTANAISYEFLGGGSFQSSGSYVWRLPSYSDSLVGKSRIIDSIKRSNDSIYAYKLGTPYFQYKDSISDTASVVIAKVHNSTGTILQRGEVVYLSGASGDVASVQRANNKQDSTSSKTFGIVRREIPIGGTGFVTTQGQIEKLNLGSFTAGDILYLDSIDGKLTNVVPVAPYHSVFIGIVERANNGNGLMYVKPQNGYELDELHNVQINGKLNNQILVYSDTQKVWKNRSVYSVVDTTSLSSRINTKLNASDTASLSSRINAKLSASDTISLSNRINAKFNTSDTTLLQQKSLPANSFMGNNTTSAANPTAQIFKQFGNQTYSDSITFTGTLNPSGAINHSFRWSQIGNLVTLHLTLTFASNGTISQVGIEIPDGLPIPILPTGLSSNNDIICYGSGYMVSTTTGVSTVFSKVFLRQNTGLTNDYEIVINQGIASTYRIINVTIQYFAQ
jgi:hypothetical protein